MKTSITISTRIYGGFAMVLALLLAVAVAGLLALRSGSASLETYAKVSDNAVRVATIRGNLADMRRNVVNVANSGNATAIERVRQLEGSVRALLPLAIADTIDPGRLANLRRMQELFDQYATLFERVVTLKADKDRLVRDRMTPLGVEARKKLLELLKGAAEDGDLAGVTLAAEADDALMAVRVDVNKYLVEPSPDLARQAEGQAENFAAYSDELVGRLREPARKALAQEARALAVQYQAAFAEVVTATNQLHEAVFVQMVGMGTQFTQLADDTTASQEAFLDGLKSDTIDGMHRGLTTSLAIAFAALALGVALSGLIARGIVRPVRAMTGVMGELADNNLTVAVPYAGQGDEIGAMARSVAHFKDQLIRVRQLEAEQEEQKKKAEAERLAAMRKMADTFEGSVGKVIGSVTSAASQLQAASGQMAGTATQTSTQATTVASAAQQASANVETVAAATEELAASIREIAQQVQRSQAVSVRACDEARTTNQHIQALSETASRIGQVVGLISTIAHQTNLLAMNATIEAARAGEAGKGFAVVAAEVKALATQTAEATDEIAAQIKAVQEGTASAVQAIDSITKVIGEMGEIGTAVAAAVEQQTGATGEIARNVEQASSGTAEVSSNIASVEQAARETGAAAGQIRDSATDLARQAEYLRGEVGQFLAQVRADKKDMRLLAWSDDLAFGIPTIDDHHRMLFEQVNELYREMMTGDAGRAAIATISRVGASVKDHFAEEEALMREHAYAAADTAEHARQHQLFLDHFAELGDAVAHNLPESGVRLFEYVATWFHEHITKSDKALADHLRAKG